METITIYFIFLVIISSVKTQVLEEDSVDLVCPEGLLAAGFTWYNISLRDFYGGNTQASQKFSICINCKPETKERYQWIEICFANNENPVGGEFTWETQMCDKTFDGTNQFLLDLCQSGRPVCGLTLTTGMPSLKLAISGTKAISCKNQTTIRENHLQIAGYDIDLDCPENSTLLGMERYNLPASDDVIPVLSAFCKVNNYTKEHMIFIYAKGKSQDKEMMKLFGKSPGCPSNSVKGGGTRCNITDSTKNYCKLRWHSTGSEKPAFDFLKCPERIEMKPDVESSVTEDKKNYIIIGACCGVFILLIISIAIIKVKLKKPKSRDKFKENVMTENALPIEGSNTFELTEEDLAYEEVEQEQTESKSRTLQMENKEIPDQNSDIISIQSNDAYLYTEMPHKEEESTLNQTLEDDNNCIKAYMYIE